MFRIPTVVAPSQRAAPRSKLPPIGRGPVESKRCAFGGHRRRLMRRFASSCAAMTSPRGQDPANVRHREALAALASSGTAVGVVLSGDLSSPTTDGSPTCLDHRLDRGRPARETAMRRDCSKIEAVLAALLMAGALGGCGGDNTASNVDAPGSKESAGTRALEAGAAVLQSKPPVDAINAYLDGFHFYSGRMRGQMEAHHYCAILNDDLIQCVIYDGNVKDAKIMGVEYIVSEKIFAGLPEQEKVLWHSHVHEVKSGQLIAPGIPEVAEHALMARLVRTYGKTWHTWHTDLHKDLPLGVPQLMMGFTADGQIDQGMVDARNQRFGVSTEEKIRNRADLPTPSIARGADAWEQGRTVQLADPTGLEHALPNGAQAHPEATVSRPAKDK